MKEFFNSPKAIFIAVAVLLNIGSLGLVFASKIDFSTFLQSIGLISAGVIALYQFYIKREVIIQANQIVNTLNAVNNQNVELKQANDDLNIKMSNMEMSMTKNAEAAKPVTKRSYTKKSN